VATEAEGEEDYYVQATKSTGYNIFEILNGIVQRAKPSTIQMVSELTSIVRVSHNCDSGCTVQQAPAHPRRPSITLSIMS
jgi:hypothetical protein